MNPVLAAPNTLSITGSRLKLLLLLGIVLGPMLLAYAMYHGQFWVPSERTYHGQLIGDGTQRQALGVEASESRWQLLVTTTDNCNADCQALVYTARQINIALNREALRVTHALASGIPVSQTYQTVLAREYPQLSQYPLDSRQYQQQLQDPSPSLWIVDPLGYIVLRYAPSDNGRDILKDLQLLLKLSRIG